LINYRADSDLSVFRRRLLPWCYGAFKKQVQTQLGDGKDPSEER
jgi:hypothetical protein